MLQNEIDKYADMAKLSVSDDERVLIEKIYERIKTVCELDTDGAEPMVSVLDVENVLREDSVVKDNSAEKLFADGRYFVVPRSID